MSRRFFAESPILAQIGEELDLAGNEAHHLIHVMRAVIGDQVVLFDGMGREFNAKIVAIQRKEVRLQLLDESLIDREPCVKLTVAVAFPKADRQRVLIEKLVEIGVTTVVPLITGRAVVVPKSTSISRLERVVIEASKQCGRNRLMQILSPVKAAEMLADGNCSGSKLIASTASGIPLREGLLHGTGKLTSDYIVAVGPEGGFTDQELQLARDNNWQSVTLGSRILRAETAAISIAAYIMLSTETPE